MVAIFAVFFLFRRNRRKKDLEADAFYRTHFAKSSVKLDYTGVNPTPSPYPHSLAAIMIERRVDVVRSPSISSNEDLDLEQGQSPQEQSFSSNPEGVTPPRSLTPADTKIPS